MHDDRCEADWNDGICACSERRENVEHGFFRPADPPNRLDRLVDFLLDRFKR